ncbi:MAG: hypothetical protein ACFFER_00040 [Candidatus Thorarchaeota archaeon]
MEQIRERGIPMAQAILIESIVFLVLVAMGVVALMLILAYSVWGEEEEE